MTAHFPTHYAQGNHNYSLVGWWRSLRHLDFAGLIAHSMRNPGPNCLQAFVYWGEDYVEKIDQFGWQWPAFIAYFECDQERIVQHLHPPKRFPSREDIGFWLRGY